MLKKRILGIDFGLKRIGLALSDASLIIASPLENFEASADLKKTVRDLVLHLEQLKKARQFELGEVVVGLPLHMNGTESERSSLVRQFAALLQEALNLPVHLLDERLSSVQAERALMETGYSRKKRAGFVDRVASVIMLQTYLNQRGPK